jgi:hypothetical protein
MATVVPQFRNPWVQSLPQFLQNVALNKMAYRFKASEGQKGRDFHAEEAMRQREYESGLLPGQRAFELQKQAAGKEVWGNPVEMTIQGKKVFLQKSNLGKVRQISSGATPSTNVSVYNDMTKRTQGDLEESIVMGGDTLAKLDRVNELFKPEYLEYAGKGKAWLQDKASKFGLETGKFLEGYNAWKMEVDAHTLLWRKFITGVAGGPKEMEAIERTTINTKYDSPAKEKQLRILTEAKIKRAKDLLSKGFDIQKMSPEQRARVVKDYPIKNYGYKEIEIPKGQTKREYDVGAVYEDASGNQMRLSGYDKKGNPIWEKP